MVYPLPQGARPKMGVPERFIGRKDGASGDALGLQSTHHLVVVLLSGPFFYDPVHLIVVPVAGDDSGKAGVLLELWTAHDPAEAAELFVGANGDSDPFILPFAAVGPLGS